MTTDTLPLVLPIRLNDHESVKLWLHNAPSPELHAALNELGFRIIGYPDERMGHVDNLDEACAVAAAHGNSIWKQETVGESSGHVLGALDAHARIYVPDMASSRVRGRILVSRGTEVTKLQDEWVAWSKIAVEVTV